MHLPRPTAAALLGAGALVLSGAEPQDGCEASPTPVPASGAGVRLSEVMWNPVSGPELVEIINDTDEPADLSGLLLTDDEGLDTAEGSFVIPAGVVLPPGGYYAVGAAAWGGLSATWGAGGPALANAGDGVSLVRDPEGDGLFTEADVVDAMTYLPAMGGDGDGSSLVRVCLGCDGTAPSSWGPSSQWGGTPGASNDSAPFVTPTPAPPTPPPSPGTGLTVLFDAGHCQRCGDADWVITGGYSDFADALEAEGFTVTSTTSDFSATSLADAAVLVIPEPQDPLSAAEQAALVEHLRAGRGILMIANHIGSDRDGDGWDAVEVLNGYQQGTRTSSNDWLASNVGIRFNEKQYNAEPLTDVRSHPSVAGVEAVGMYAGTTVQIVDTARATGVIYPPTSSWGPFVAAVTPAVGGRVVALGDSSPFDDGTCSCSDSLTDNWQDWDHPALAVSAVTWLAGRS